MCPLPSLSMKKKMFEQKIKFSYLKDKDDLTASRNDNAIILELAYFFKSLQNFST